MKKIDFNDFRSSTNIVVLSGRPKGLKARDNLDLDKIDEKEGFVIVEVPEDYRSISTSFILGLFGNSVRNLGRDGFFKKYKFEGKDISQQLRNCVDEALKREL